MSDLLFTEDHEWLRPEGDDLGVVGITDYAQEQLGELVYIELPEVGAEIVKGAEIAVIESVKAASELNAPASGTVLEVNEGLSDEPAIVNADPEGEGWFIKIQLSAPRELDELMNEEAYEAYVQGLE